MNITTLPKNDNKNSNKKKKMSKPSSSKRKQSKKKSKVKKPSRTRSGDLLPVFETSTNTSNGMGYLLHNSNYIVINFCKFLNYMVI